MDKKILNKYIEGNASQEEKEAVQLWLETDEKNWKEFMSLRTLYDIALGHLSEEQAKKITLQRRNVVADFLKIAAAILITFLCTYYYMRPQQEEPLVVDVKPMMQTLHVPAGQRAELTLTDGTKVWLNSLTTFTFPDRFTETKRDVYLDGEGYFDIAPDEEKPFNVNTHNYVIKALGTEFNVLAYSKVNSFETSLIDGSVEVTSYDNRQNVLLAPGDKVYRDKNSLQTSSIQHYDYFLWKKGIISFDHERVGNMLKKLELYYDIRIENRNKSILDMRYTGKFRTKDGIEHALKVLQIPTGLHYQKDNENNLIQIY